MTNSCQDIIRSKKKRAKIMSKFTKYIRTIFTYIQIHVSIKFISIYHFQLYNFLLYQSKVYLQCMINQVYNSHSFILIVCQQIMKHNQSELKFNFHSQPNNSISHYSNKCQHKIYRLYQRQNCPLPSAMCNQKCFQKQNPKHLEAQHQQLTQIELRRFMNKKIDHNNKGISLFKKQVLSQFQIANDILKSMRQNILKGIDMLFYEAVKSSNEEITSHSIDKFYNSNLSDLSCHQVYCIFNFKPNLSLKLSQRISEIRQSTIRQVIQLNRELNQKKLYVSQKMIKYQMEIFNRNQNCSIENIKNKQNQQVSKQAINKQTIHKQVACKQTIIKQTINKQAISKQLACKQAISKQASKLNTVEYLNEDRRAKQMSKDSSFKNDKQSKLRQKDEVKPPVVKEMKNPENKPTLVQKCRLFYQKTDSKPSETNNKLIQPSSNKNHQEKISIPKLTSSQSNSKLLDQNNRAVIREKTRAQTKSSTLMAKQQQPKQKMHLMEVQKMQNFKKQNSQKLNSQSRQFQILCQKFKLAGSLDKMFHSTSPKRQSPVKTLNPKIVQKLDPNSKPTLTQSNQRLTPRQNKSSTSQIGEQKTTVFDKMKRHRDLIKQKQHSQGRKIIKTDNNQFQTVQNTLKPQQSQNTSKTHIQSTQIEKSNNKITQQTQQKLPIQSKQKKNPTQHTENQKKYNQNNPILSPSDKIVLQLVRQSSQSEAYPKNLLSNAYLTQQQTQSKSYIDKNSYQTKQSVENIQKHQQITNTLPQLRQHKTQGQKSTISSVVDKQPNKVETIIQSEIKQDILKKQSNSRPFLPKPSDLLNKSAQKQVGNASIQKNTNMISDSEKQDLSKKNENLQKRIKINNPRFNLFGRVKKDYHFDFNDVFEKAQQNRRQSLQKKQQLNRVSLLGQLQNTADNTCLEHSTKKISLQKPKHQFKHNDDDFQSHKGILSEQRKGLQKKFNFDNRAYDHNIPNFLKPK